MCEQCLGVPDSVDEYLVRLACHLPGSWWHRRRIVAEVREHLADTVWAALGHGLGEEEAQRRAVAGLGSPAVMAAEFPHRGIQRCVAVIAVAGIAGVIFTAVAISPGGQPQASAGVVAMSPYPQRAWAVGCVSLWNDPAFTAIRRAVAGDGPFRVDTFPPVRAARDVGTPVRALLWVGPSPLACGWELTFQHRARLTWLDVGRHPDGRIVSFYDPDPTPSAVAYDQQTLPWTAVLPNGSLSTDVRPPPALGAWGGHLSLSATVLKDRVAITSNSTCFDVKLTLHRPGTDTNPARVGLARRVTHTIVPGVPKVLKYCFSWRGHIHDPLAAIPGLRHPAQREVDFAVREHRIGMDSTVAMLFHIVPARPGTPATAQTTRWAVVYSNGYDLDAHRAQIQAKFQAWVVASASKPPKTPLPPPPSIRPAN